VRIIRKVPELQENFVTRAKAVFQERNHATILTGLTLVQELCSVDPSLIPQFREVLALCAPPRTTHAQTRTHAITALYQCDTSATRPHRREHVRACTERGGPGAPDEGPEHRIGLVRARGQRHR
jgi:hypothetical protein